MDRPPVVTVFGTCRVQTPTAILAAQGQVVQNQRNIFGFVHNAPEVWQQFEIITGSRCPPPRLRPFLNIGLGWPAPEPAAIERFQADFAETDLFLVEISSIRLLRFQDALLQINRTREILAPDAARHDWWKRILRRGENRVAEITPFLTDPTEMEVATGLTLTEQPQAALAADAARIAGFLRKPVIFATTFNCDLKRRPIAQRSTIADALARLEPSDYMRVFDPTHAVLDHGLDGAVRDLGHYTEAFEPHIAALLHRSLDALWRQRRTTD